MTRFLLIKHRLLSVNESHFAGGKHAFLCLARSLRDAGHDVSVLVTLSRAELLVASIQGGFAAQLRQCKTTGCARDAVTWWHDGLSWHAVLVDALVDGAAAADTADTADTAAGAAPGLASDMLAAADHLIATPPCSTTRFPGALLPPQPGGSAEPATSNDGRRLVVVIDADESQQPPQAQDATSSPAIGAARSRGGSSGAVSATTQAQPPPPPQQQQQSLFELVVLKWGRAVHALVQNVHFLPFGPNGTSPRSPGLLRAWTQQLGGVIAVSNFVSDYVLRWAPQQAAELGVVAGCEDSGAAAPHGAASCNLTTAADCAAAGRATTALNAPVHVVPLAAWGVYGAGPFADLGSDVHRAMLAAEPAAGQQDAAVGTGCRRRPPHRTVGVLKFSPEKGASIVVALAERLPRLGFLAVAADPQAAGAAAGCRLPPNLELVPPAADVDDVLRCCGLLLVPSLWEEAWGMVATEALLRGLPVVSSDRGGLPEAGLSVSTVVVTVPIAIHPDPATGAPCWARRAYPSALQQDMDAWQAAVEEVLVSGGPDAYLRRSQECRRTALDHLAAAQHRGIMQPFAVAD